MQTLRLPPTAARATGGHCGVHRGVHRGVYGTRRARSALILKNKESDSERATSGRPCARSRTVSARQRRHGLDRLQPHRSADPAARRLGPRRIVDRRSGRLPADRARLPAGRRIPVAYAAKPAKPARPARPAGQIVSARRPRGAHRSGVAVSAKKRQGKFAGCRRPRHAGARRRQERPAQRLIQAVPRPPEILKKRRSDNMLARPTLRCTRPPFGVQQTIFPTRFCQRFESSAHGRTRPQADPRSIR